MTSQSATASITAAPTTAEVASELQDAAEHNDRNRIGELVEAMTSGADSAGVAELARRRERVGRLLESLQGMTNSVGGGYALGHLDAADHMLDRLRTRALGVQAQEQRARRAETVREQVLGLIDAGPRRPGDLARELHVDPSQVSRALGELRRSGMVERGAAQTQDGRAHVFVSSAPRRQPARAR